MRAGIIQLVVGGILIAAGLSGQVMRGTTSSTPLIVMGGALIGLGIFRWVRAGRRSGDDDQS